MFQFRRFPTYTYFIQCTLTEYGSAGFPHSDIHGSVRMCRSPWLFAACHVLLRLLMPRHSPCALSSLTLRRNGLRFASPSLRRASAPLRHSSFSEPNPLALGFVSGYGGRRLVHSDCFRIMQARRRKLRCSSSSSRTRLRWASLGVRGTGVYDNYRS